MSNRMRTLLGAGVLALVLGLLPTTSHAGVGQSQGCTDGITQPGGTELGPVPVLDTLITVAVETGGTTPYLQLCFSTTPEGNAGPAVVGGWVWVTLSTPDPGLSCTRDTSPTVVGIDCALRDDNPTSPGRTLEVTLYLQGTPVTLVAGIELGTPAPLVCLRNTTVYTPAGTFPFTALGACL